jgi:hypothetical protein
LPLVLTFGAAARAQKGAKKTTAKKERAEVELEFGNPVGGTAGDERRAAGAVLDVGVQLVEAGLQSWQTTSEKRW